MQDQKTTTEAKPTNGYPTRYAAFDEPQVWHFFSRTVEPEHRPGCIMEAAVYHDTSPHHKYNNLSDGVYAHVLRHQGWKSFAVEIHGTPHSHGNRSASEQVNRMYRAGSITDALSYLKTELPRVYAAIGEEMPPGALALPTPEQIRAQHMPGADPITGEGRKVALLEGWSVRSVPEAYAVALYNGKEEVCRVGLTHPDGIAPEQFDHIAGVFWEYTNPAHVANMARLRGALAEVLGVGSYA